MRKFFGRSMPSSDKSPAMLQGFYLVVLWASGLTMKKIRTIFLLLFLAGLIYGSAYAQDVVPMSQAPAASSQNAVIPTSVAEDADDENNTPDVQDINDVKPAAQIINEVIKKIYDRIIASKEKYKELAAFDEKCLTMSPGGFLSLHYETEVPSRSETYPFIFKIDVEPLKTPTAKAMADQGYFDYALPLLNLQFSGYVVKHPLRRQFNIQSILEEYAEELVDYQQQFMPLRFMIIAEEKSFKVNKPIYFKVVLINTSEHNILVKSLGKETLFFTLNRSVWGTQFGEAQVLSPREKARQDRAQQAAQRAQMRELLRRQRKNQGGQTIIGPRTHVGDKTILHVGEALAIDFSGEGYKRAQDVEIRGIYQLNVKGLRPTGKVTIKIVDD